MTPNVAASLKGLVLPLGALVRHPRNARQGDVGAIAASLARFGQQKPIVAQRRDGGPHVIVAGNHLYEAARQMGWDGIAVNVSDMTDREASAFLVADNRTQELGSYDEDVLAGLLRDIAEAGDLAGTGYDGDDVDALLARLASTEPIVGDAPEETTTVVWGVVIELSDEGEQLVLLSELGARGLNVRALMS